MKLRVLLFSTLCLFGSVWAQTPSPSPSPASQLAILIIGDHTNAGMSNLERVLTENIRQDLKDQGISAKSVPVIFYHIDKPNEKKYCAVKLHIQPAQLLFAGVVQHENFVVRSILYQAQQIQVPEDAAEHLVAEAAEFLKRTDLPALPSPSPSVDTTPINTLAPEQLKTAFLAYRDGMKPLLEAELTLQSNFQQAVQSRRSGQMAPAAFLDLLNQNLIPAARDLGATAQKVSLQSPEVLHLHQSYTEATSYLLKQYESLADGLAHHNDTLTHLADNYGQLAASARSRWQLEYTALEQRYQP